MPRVKSVRIRSRFLRAARASPLHVALVLLARVSAAQTAGPAPAASSLPAPDPGGEKAHALGRLEQESVGDAMKTLGQPLVDPAPQGKTIGKVFVANEDVFSQRDWYFQLLNIFHRTTRSYIVERELLFKPGQTYDQALVEETTRNLQTPPPIVVSATMTSFSTLRCALSFINLEATRAPMPSPIGWPSAKARAAPMYASASCMTMGMSA